MANRKLWLSRSNSDSSFFEHYLPILKIGLPIAVGQIGVIVMGFADTMMVGNYTTASLAAASFVNSVFNLVTYLLLGYSYGVTPLIGYLMGQGRHTDAGAALKQALVANVLFASLVLFILSCLYFFLDRMGQPAELLPLIRPYYLCIMLSMAFVAVFNCLRQFTDGLSDTSVGMWTLLVSNVANIIGNYLLIYGKCGFPEMGLLGAGISTAFSRFLMMALVVVVLLLRPRYAVFRKGFVRCTLRWKEVWNVHTRSFPLSLQMGMESGAFAFSGIMAGWLSALDLASYQVLITISTLGFLLYYSFASAMSIRVANYYGRAEWTNLHKTTRAGTHILLTMVVISSLMFYFLGTFFISCFTRDTAVIALASAVIPSMILYQLGDGMQICFSNALRGTGNVRPMMRIAFLSYVVVNLPVAYLLAFPLHLGIRGLFLAFSSGLFVAAYLFFKQYHLTIRRLKASSSKK